MDKKAILKTISLIIITSALVGGFILAGNLNPSGAPAASLKTLEDIYVRLTAGTAASAHNIYPSGATAASMHTLDQIYDAIPSASSVLNSVLSWGTANTPPGSGDEATANQVISGYYAFKADGTTLTGSATASLVWQTGSASEGLCWTFTSGGSCYPGNGVLLPYGGTWLGEWTNLTWTGPTYLFNVSDEVTDSEDYTYWACTVSHSAAEGLTFAQERAANPTAWRQIYPMGAKEYCQYLNPDGSTLNCTGVSPNVTCTSVDYWRLPTAAELGTAFYSTFFPIDDTLTAGGTPGGFEYSTEYWSSSDLGDAAYAVYFVGSVIYDSGAFKTSSLYWARCVR